jgi:hypothetical protein
MNGPTARHGFLGVSLAAAMAVAYFALLAPGLSSAETEAGTGTTAVIKMAIVKGKLKFVYPKTVTQGEELEIVNTTNPRQVGPHTFSLVQPGLIPKTKPQRQNCFTPKHICMSIAKWHKFNPKTEKVGVNPTSAGAAGWSTMGTNKKKGDSWFTGETKGTSITAVVNAKAGTTLYFMCAVHPWMHGKVKVLPAPAG